jgi:hypothetical protein
MQAQLAQSPELPIEIHVGKTPEIIDVGQVCLSVSGSVSLELLNKTIPTVTLYKVGAFWMPLVRVLQACEVHQPDQPAGRSGTHTRVPDHHRYLTTDGETADAVAR